jgi:hypothetical protein
VIAEEEEEEEEEVSEQEEEEVVSEGPQPLPGLGDASDVMLVEQWHALFVGPRMEAAATSGHVVVTRSELACFIKIGVPSGRSEVRAAFCSCVPLFLCSFVLVFLCSCVPLFLCSRTLTLNPYPSTCPQESGKGLFQVCCDIRSLSLDGKGRSIVHYGSSDVGQQGY